MIKAKCIRECIWQRRHWRQGDVYTGAETPPSHFAILSAPASQLSEPEAPLAGEPVSEATEPKKTRKKKNETPDEGEE